MKYSGIDPHSNNSVVVVIHEADRVAYQRRLPNELASIVRTLPPYRQELSRVLIVELTCNWQLTDSESLFCWPSALRRPGCRTCPDIVTCHARHTHLAVQRASTSNWYWRDSGGPSAPPRS